MKLVAKLVELYKLFRALEANIEKMRQSIGRIEARQLAHETLMGLQEAEFQVFSQWGEDGIIQYLVNKIEITNPIFVEFGVETYIESNTRYLLTNDNWSGLVIDGSSKNIEYIKRDPIYWRHNLKAVSSFIDRDNINQTLLENGISGDIGLLSIDIDGIDYYVFDALNVIKPRIIICEYNSLWGPDESVSVPYDPLFDRSNSHFSNLYFGASISALTTLANKKGYSLVGSNTTGVNIFFVRNDLIGDIKIIQPKDAWIKSKFRESRDCDKKLTFLGFEERLRLIGELPLINFSDQKIYKVKELIGVDK